MDGQQTRTGAKLPTEETNRLIASDKVEGTDVYNLSGDHLGKVHNFMVDKRTGHVAYAVMSFGGFLGIGERYHPLPWKVLSYETQRDGYVVDLDEDTLKRAPSFTADAAPDWRLAGYSAGINEFYGIPPYSPPL